MCCCPRHNVVTGEVSVNQATTVSTVPRARNWPTETESYRESGKERQKHELSLVFLVLVLVPDISSRFAVEGNEFQPLSSG